MPKSLHKSVEQVYGTGGLREVYCMQMLHTFWSMQEALVEYFKDAWVRVNPNSPMNLMSDITNEENKECDRFNSMIKVQVCDVFIFQKPLLIIW